MSWYRWDDDDLILQLRVQPKARTDEFSGPYGTDQFKIRITAPPVDGKANKYLATFLAKQFGVAKSAVSLVSGETSRDKIFRIASPTRQPIPDIKQ